MDASQGAQPKSQHKRCKQLWDDQQNDFLTTLDDPERKYMAESSSTLGRKWLDTIPYYPSLRLTDFEVSTAIHYRTLSTSPLTIAHGAQNRTPWDMTRFALPDQGRRWPGITLWLESSIPP